MSSGAFRIGEKEDGSYSARPFGGSCLAIVLAGKQQSDVTAALEDGTQEVDDYPSLPEQ